MPAPLPAPTPATSSASRPEAGGSTGALLRAWRARRRLSQLALALEAGVSARHLGFVELGRARPSRAVLHRLAGPLALSPRERNRLLLAAGYAPEVPERPLDDPALAPARAAVERVLAAHEPYPALAVDRHWTLLAANRAVAPVLFAGAADVLLRPPINVLRLTLHPHGMAPRIVNFAEWRAALLGYLGAQVAATADPVLSALFDELVAYPEPHPSAAAASGDRSSAASRAARAAGGDPPSDGAGVFVPLRLASDAGELAFLSTVTVFATPVDVTLAELVVECFFPADAATAERLRVGLAGDGSAAATPGGPSGHVISTA